MNDPVIQLPIHNVPTLNLSEAALDIYEGVRSLPIVSPHGHCKPQWFSENRPFADPAELLIIPDSFVVRMLYSHGVSPEDMGIGVPPEQRDARAIFRVFASHWHKFRGTPSHMWISSALAHVFGVVMPLNEETADQVYDRIDAELKSARMYPQSLLQTFNIEVLATTDSALDDLAHHKAARRQKLRGKIIPTFRPDSVLDPKHPDFAADVAALGDITGEDTQGFTGYLEALRERRAYFMANGATATDHVVDELMTCHLTEKRAATLFAKALAGTITPKETQVFYGHMLTEMAQMSVEDGLVMQIHAGNLRNTNKSLYATYGANMGADMPVPVDWVRGMDALLNRVGNVRDMNILLFTLDESTYARELAPMVGHWPALRLGAPWRFHDSANGIARYLDQVVETAGYWNLAGFNDDTRALMSIPARHDMWRRGVSLHLSQQRSRGVLGRSDADEIARLLCRDLAIEAYKLGKVV
ncbi:glucuronate isomerase [Shimia sp. MMG029]|uniref:glucuronate isomerase n=1 Tax=Shimia sp. MMG029 TaxID=3021978 RepID=UPI0022FE3E52|nr:glucuronate isomerase [Shimia sp. MMG029]MDA5558026.1 glucuronate isomerase [Shimia sp. MMG029]